MSIDVEKGQLLKPSRISTVDEEARAHPRLEVAGGEIVAIEIEHPLRRAPPGETIGQTMHQAIIEREHKRRVDGVRRLYRCGVRHPDILCSLSGHGWTV